MKNNAELDAFRELNAGDAERGKKTPWAERVRLINKVYPAATTLDWKRAFDADIDLFGRIIRDILKLDTNTPGRPGPRPQLDEATAAQRFRALTGEDYAIEPFAVAFRWLVGDRSIRHVAAKTGLNRNQVFRLLSGEVQPDAYVMECIGKGFNRDPAYFLEYRMVMISAALLHRIGNAPEASIGLYRKLAKKESA